MTIKKLTAKNFRSLKDITISEFDFTTIFFGDNNAGKSNILSLLYLIFKRKSQRIGAEEEDAELINFYTGIIPDSRNNYFNNEISRPISFEVDIDCDKTDLDIHPLIESLFEGKEVVTFKFQGTITPQLPFDQRYSDFRVLEIKMDTIPIYLNRETVSFFPTIPDKDGKKVSEFNRAFTQLVDIFNDCVDIVGSHRDMIETKISNSAKNILNSHTFKSYLYNLYVSKKDYQIFEEIDRIFSEPPFSYGHLSFSIDEGKLDIEIKQNHFRLPIKHFGSGVLQALYIITAIVCSKGKIVCIEELEQNLSPENQKDFLSKLQQLIREGQAGNLDQIIISSHSIVYNDTNLGAIYLIKKEGGETRINPKEEEAEESSQELEIHFNAAKTRRKANRSPYKGTQPI